ncbi:hypothetical protein [Paenibacillus agricola]|uniref:Dynamin family protein n=1 Tax=Paenibacillus agricola TaxID=2716264 RepID=A0ABX0JFV4_9BACL|nr:hypothetical protein [Paenibacillus agricola]NHN34413.1 hypothetical protein [Paenibacillus agricola]
MINSRKKTIKAAVIGRSASGKSAFIRSFSRHPELIKSVGRGQTTRSYAEYRFLLKSEDKPTDVIISFLNERTFVRKRTDQVIEKFSGFLKKENKTDLTIDWMKEQIEEYYDDLIEAVIYSTDFFDVREFNFLSTSIVWELEELFKEICIVITDVQKKQDTDAQQFKFFDLKKLTDFKIINSSETDSSKYNISENTSELVERVWILFFTIAYQIIIKAVQLQFKNHINIPNDNEPIVFKFTLDESYKGLLELCLTVVNTQLSEKSSLSGMIEKVIITSIINKEYYSKLQPLNINSIILVDTYGLDHANPAEEPMLIERYRQIFNVDYPGLSAAFFVEPIRPGAATTFLNEIEILYSQKPSIMTYVVASHIDEQSDLIISKNKEWLLLEEKNGDYTEFDGKVLDLLFKSNKIISTLKRNRIPETLANKRVEIMRKRLAPFCGKDQNFLKNPELMNDMNLISITSLVTSIIDQEHLGDGYINIEKLKIVLLDKEKVLPFAKILIDEATKIFQRLFVVIGPRTKWKYRTNLSSNILGFDGSVFNVTWYRIFNDAYNYTFTKQVEINREKVMLSDVYGFVGNEKVAFDELMTLHFGSLFNKPSEGELLQIWPQEISLKNYKETEDQRNSMWGILLDCIQEIEVFNYQNYGSVLEWLNHLHNFTNRCDEKFYNSWYEIFFDRMNNSFMKACREHNYKVAAVKAKRSEKSYFEKKEELYLEYSQNYDSQIEKEVFFSSINEL